LVSLIKLSLSRKLGFEDDPIGEISNYINEAETDFSGAAHDLSNTAQEQINEIEREFE
jgi:hypothetical protein